MLKYKALTMAALAAVVSLSSCKPTEENYRKAYEAARAGQEEQEDETIYSNVRREMRQLDLVVGADTVPLRSQWVKVTADGGGLPESLKKYCVVAGQFKQAFNAKSMRERLLGQGYPGAFVVQTREPYYFVVVSAYSDAAQAVAALDALKADTSLKLLPPAPFLFQPAQIR